MPSGRPLDGRQLEIMRRDRLSTKVLSWVLTLMLAVYMVPLGAFPQLAGADEPIKVSAAADDDIDIGTLANPTFTITQDQAPNGTVTGGASDKVLPIKYSDKVTMTMTQTVPNWTRPTPMASQQSVSEPKVKAKSVSTKSLSSVPVKAAGDPDDLSGGNDPNPDEVGLDDDYFASDGLINLSTDPEAAADMPGYAFSKEYQETTGQWKITLSYPNDNEQYTFEGISCYFNNETEEAGNFNEDTEAATELNGVITKVYYLTNPGEETTLTENDKYNVIASFTEAETPEQPAEIVFTSKMMSISLGGWNAETQSAGDAPSGVAMEEGQSFNSLASISEDGKTVTIEDVPSLTEQGYTIDRVLVKRNGEPVDPILTLDAEKHATYSAPDDLKSDDTFEFVFLASEDTSSAQEFDAETMTFNIALGTYSSEGVSTSAPSGVSMDPEDSFATVTKQPIGGSTIEFTAIPGYTKPALKNYTVPYILVKRGGTEMTDSLLPVDVIHVGIPLATFTAPDNLAAGETFTFYFLLQEGEDSLVDLDENKIKIALGTDNGAESGIDPATAPDGVSLTSAASDVVQISADNKRVATISAPSYSKSNERKNYEVTGYVVKRGDGSYLPSATEAYPMTQTQFEAPADLGENEELTFIFLLNETTPDPYKVNFVVAPADVETCLEGGFTDQEIEFPSDDPDNKTVNIPALNLKPHYSYYWEGSCEDSSASGYPTVLPASPTAIKASTVQVDGVTYTAKFTKLASVQVVFKDAAGGPVLDKTIYTDDTDKTVTAPTASQAGTKDGMAFYAWQCSQAGAGFTKDQLVAANSSLSINPSGDAQSVEFVPVFKPNKVENLTLKVKNISRTFFENIEDTSNLTISVKRKNPENDASFIDVAGVTIDKTISNDAVDIECTIPDTTDNPVLTGETYTVTISTIAHNPDISKLREMSYESKTKNGSDYQYAETAYKIANSTNSKASGTAKSGDAGVRIVLPGAEVAKYIDPNLTADKANAFDTVTYVVSIHNPNAGSHVGSIRIADSIKNGADSINGNSKIHFTGTVKFYASNDANYDSSDTLMNEIDKNLSGSSFEAMTTVTNGILDDPSKYLFAVYQVTLGETTKVYSPELAAYLGKTLTNTASVKLCADNNCEQEYNVGGTGSAALTIYDPNVTFEVTNEDTITSAVLSDAFEGDTATVTVKIPVSTISIKKGDSAKSPKLYNPQVKVDISSPSGSATQLGTIVGKATAKYGSTTKEVTADNAKSIVLSFDATEIDASGSEFIELTYQVAAPDDAERVNASGVVSTVTVSGANMPPKNSGSITSKVALPLNETTSVLDKAQPNAKDKVHITHTLTQKTAGSSYYAGSTFQVKDALSGSSDFSAIKRFQNVKVTVDGNDVTSTVSPTINGELLTFGAQIPEIKQTLVVEYDDEIGNAGSVCGTVSKNGITVLSFPNTSAGKSDTTDGTKAATYTVQTPNLLMSKKLTNPLSEDDEDEPAVVNIGDTLDYEAVVSQTVETARLTDAEYTDTVDIYDEENNLIEIGQWPEATPYFVEGSIVVKENGTDVTSQYDIAYLDAKEGASSSSSNENANENSNTENSNTENSNNNAGDNANVQSSGLAAIVKSADVSKPTKISIKPKSVDVDGAHSLTITAQMKAGDASSRVLKGKYVGATSTATGANLTQVSGVAATVATAASARTPIADATISIAKSSDKTTVAAGGTVHYKLTVTNTSEGVGIAKNPTVADTLDKAAYDYGYRLLPSTLKVSLSGEDITSTSKVEWTQAQGFSVTAPANINSGAELTVEYDASTDAVPTGSYSNTFINNATARTDNAAMVAATKLVSYDGTKYSNGTENLNGGTYSDEVNGGNGSGSGAGAGSDGSGSGGTTAGVPADNAASSKVVGSDSSVSKTEDIVLYVIGGIAIAAIIAGGAVFFFRRKR